MTETAACETHVSWVFFKGDQALKFYKPVVTDVVDYSTPTARLAAAQQELTINRRFSPDVYLGVAHLAGDGIDTDSALVMRRLPEARSLSALLGTPEEDDAIKAVARRVATIHAEAPRLAANEAEASASAHAVLARITADIAELKDLADDMLDVAQCDDLQRLAQAYVSGRGDLFASRIADGHAVDGHGDLRADDIFVMDDGVRILDALAFSDRLRHGDVLADLSFLVMDLHQQGHLTAAQRLLRHYCSLSDEHHPGSLAHYYVAQRAIVRAKVSALRYRQARSITLWNAVRHHAALAVDHLERSQIGLALVGGLPGSGKSTTAQSIAEHLGWIRLSTDEVRHDDVLLSDVSPVDAGDYTGRRREQTYREVLDRAALLMRQGYSVVLDATWERADLRGDALRMARELSAKTIEIRCHADPSVCRRRVAARDSTADSHATPAVVDAIAERFAPWPEAAVFDTNGSPDHRTVLVLGSLMASPWPTASRVEFAAAELVAR